MSIRSTLRFIAAAFILGACAESPTSPSSNGPDVGALLSEMNLSSVAAAADLAGGAMSADFGRLPVPDPRNCSYSTASGWFECQPITLSGLTFTMMYRLLDAAGNSQAKPDAQTSAIETKSSVAGTMTNTVPGTSAPTSTYTINSNADQTLSGIRDDNHTLNGTSVTKLNGTLGLGTSALAIDDSTKETTTDLVLPNAKAGQKWPQSGTITLESVSNLGDPQFADTSRSVITFNGTSVVTITTTAGGVTFTCRFDLAAPLGTGSSCG